MTTSPIIPCREHLFLSWSFSAKVSSIPANDTGKDQLITSLLNVNSVAVNLGGLEMLTITSSSIGNYNMKRETVDTD